jgi:DNA-binding NarL/FixJ family response regulator
LKFIFEDYRENESKSISPLDKLTPRQREILKFVAEGETSAEIAARLGLSLKTVETHRAEIMARLKIHDVAGLTRLAIRYGLISA